MHYANLQVKVTVGTKAALKARQRYLEATELKNFSLDAVIAHALANSEPNEKLQ